MTLGELARVLPCVVSIHMLKPESYIQIIDYTTCAHYRSSGDVILLGGDATDLTMADLFSYEVEHIDFNDWEKCFEIYVEVN